MRTLFRIVKYVINVVLIVAVVLYSGLYLLLSTPAVQRYVGQIAVNRLHNVLNTNLSIGKVYIYPFSRVVIEDLYLEDQQGDTLFYARKAAAGIDLMALFDNQLRFNNIQLYRFNADIRQATPESKPNFQFIIDAFASKDTTDRKKMDFRLDVVFLKNGQINYDVMNSPRKQEGVFDVNHIRVNNFSATATIKVARPDSMNITLKRLSLKESSGLDINRLSFQLLSNKEKAFLNDFELTMPRTRLTLSNTYVDLSNVKTPDEFLTKSRFYVETKKAEIGLSDFKAFVPGFVNITQPTILSCQVNGSLDQINLQSLSLNYGETLTLEAEGSLDGLSDIDQAYLYTKIRKLNTTTAEVYDLINELSGEKNVMPKELAQLSYIHFNGELSGFISQLVAFGWFNTACGTVHTDLLVKDLFLPGAIYLKGDVRTTNFNLERLFDDKQRNFGHISLDLGIDVTQENGQRPQGYLKGNVRNFDFKGYSYENISINGSYLNSAFKGTMALNDPNGNVYLHGLLNLEAKVPVFDFRAEVRNLKVHELKLTPLYSGSNLSFNLSANFKGKHIDTSEGYVSLDSLSFENKGQNFFLSQMRVNAFNSELPQSIVIESDLINGKISGRYSFTTLPQSMINVLSESLPALVHLGTKRQVPLNNDFDINLVVGNTSDLTSVLELPVEIVDSVVVSGSFVDSERRFDIRVISPDMLITGGRFLETDLRLYKQEKEISADINTGSLNAQNGNILYLSLKASAVNDVINTVIGWRLKDKEGFNGDIIWKTSLIPQEKQSPAIRVEIQPSEFIINDTVWQVSSSEILWDNKVLSINRFEVRHQTQYLQIEGEASSDTSKVMNVYLNELSLDYIFGILNIPNVTFGGVATGSIQAARLFSTPILNTQALQIENFAYNGTRLGDLLLHSKWETDIQGILLKGTVNGNYQSKTGGILPVKTSVNGHIFPTKDSISILFDADHLNVGFLAPFLSSVAKDVSGIGSGKIRLYGRFDELNVVGDVYLEDARFGIEYLNTEYHFSDSVHLTPTEILFKNITIYDKEGHTGLVNGVVKHKNLKEMIYNVSITNLNNMLVFNQTEKQNPLFFGTVYGIGGATIYGDESQTNIDVGMRSAPNSKFNYSLSVEDVAAEYGFITFVNPFQEEQKEKQEESQPKPKVPVKEESSSILNINLQLDIQPDMLVQMIMDATLGDMIKANGTGNIRIEYNTITGVKMYGNYTLEKGSYTFILANLITKDFTIREGSTIEFRGDPMMATLDIEAIYTVTANLKDLDESFAQDRDLSRTTLPVQAVMNITGDLRRPDIQFDIEIPSASQDVVRRVKSIINTDDMMNRQVLFLLSLGRFYTPDYLSASSIQGNEIATSALTSQLNNILRQFSDNVNIGTNLDFTNQEFELALSSQLLNNRLILNGNFGYRENQTNNFIGDFDLEYLLTPNGNLRLKAYNHYNDRNYNIKSALTTQGVGLVFKRDFGTIKELFSPLYYREKKRTQSSQETDKQP